MSAPVVAADVVTLPRISVPALNACVRTRLAGMAVRHPMDAAGRLLYLQRLGALVLPHWHDGARWVCTLAGGTLDTRTVTGALLVDDVEVAAALELRDPVHPTVDMTIAEFCAAWMVRVWDRWPGGRVVQVAAALLERLHPETLTVPSGAPWSAAVARRSGITLPRGLAAPVGMLAAAGLIEPYGPDESRALLALPVEVLGS